MPAEEHVNHTDDDFEYEYDAFEYTPTNDNIDAEGLHTSCNNSSSIEYSADIIVHVSREASKKLSQKLLPFLQASTIYVKHYGTEVSSLYKYEKVYKKLTQQSQ